MKKRNSHKGSFSAKINHIKPGETLIFLGEVGRIQRDVQTKKDQGYIPKSIFCRKALVIIDDKLYTGSAIMNKGGNWE